MRILIASLIISLFGCIYTLKAQQATTNELYEIRTYHMNFRGDQGALMTYLNDVLKPSMMKEGVNRFEVYKEYGQGEPAKLWVLISYPSMDVYMKALRMTSTDAFKAKSKEYDAIDASVPTYSRMESMLLYAFDGIPQMRDPIDGAGLYELRIYEGYNEDAVRRKIDMFNDEEIELFDKVGLHMSFFGDMISGPYRPALVYMLNFKDMAERNSNWKTFLDHPEWKRMISDPKYKDTVSHIRKVFLVPVK